MSDLVEVGKVINYFKKINVAVVEATATIKKGDKIKIEGGDTSFEMPVESMQVEHKEIETAEKGTLFGMKVPQEVREGYKVFKVK